MHKWGSASLNYDLLAKDLLYPLSIIVVKGKDQKPVNAQNFKVKFLFILIRISVKNNLYCA